MKKHPKVAAALAQARQRQRCAYGSSAALRKAFNRRVHEGELVSPLRNLFIESDVWSQLSRCDQTRYIARTLSILHEQWVFAGLTAADLHGLSHSWRLHNGNVQIVDSNRSGTISGQRIERLYKPTVSAVRANDIPVTDMSTTVIDCCMRLPFDQALPIVDSALRNGLTVNMIQECVGDHAHMNRLLEYGDALSENGGESWVRAKIIAMGFARPELQVEFTNPDPPYQRYRVDFLWRIHDGRIVVLEFDGIRKYSDPAMTKGRTVRQVVEQQIERDHVLRQAGVTEIVHCFLDEVTEHLFERLRAAGVPWMGRPFD